MTRPELGTDLRRLPAPLPAWHGRVSRDAWSAAARSIAHAGGRLVSVWGVDRSASGDGMAACAAYAVSEGLVWVELKLDDPAQGFPDLATAFPCAGRMQRAMADLSGIRAEGSSDDRSWLNHGVWPPGSSPLQHAPQPEATAAAGGLPANYPFVRVDVDGVHEIAVGPVHSCIIEP